MNKKQIYEKKNHNKTSKIIQWLFEFSLNFKKWKYEIVIYWHYDIDSQITTENNFALGTLNLWQ